MFANSMTEAIGPMADSLHFATTRWRGLCNWNRSVGTNANRRPGPIHRRQSATAGLARESNALSDANLAADQVAHRSPNVFERIAAGDTRAVDECLDAYGGLVWTLVRSSVANASDAEDLVQEIFVDIWRSAGRFDDQRSAEVTFVAMIARRRIIDFQRRRRPTAVDMAEVVDRLVDQRQSPAHQAEQTEESQRAWDALATLRPEQRQVLCLALQTGLTYEQIALSTGWPIGTVKTHARRGLAALRQVLGAPVAMAGEIPRRETAS